MVRTERGLGTVTGIGRKRGRMSSGKCAGIGEMGVAETCWCSYEGTAVSLVQ